MKSKSNNPVTKTLIFVAVVFLIIGMLSYAKADSFTDCRDLDTTQAFLECVEAPEFTEQYIEVPDVDTIKQDYQDQEVGINQIEDAIFGSVQENLDADTEHVTPEWKF